MSHLISSRRPPPSCLSSFRAPIISGLAVGISTLGHGSGMAARAKLPRLSRNRSLVEQPKPRRWTRASTIHMGRTNGGCSPRLGPPFFERETYTRLLSLICRPRDACVHHHVDHTTIAQPSSQYVRSRTKRTSERVTRPKPWLFVACCLLLVSPTASSCRLPWMSPSMPPSLPTYVHLQCHHIAT